VCRLKLRLQNLQKKLDNLGKGGPADPGAKKKKKTKPPPPPKKNLATSEYENYLMYWPYHHSGYMKQKPRTQRHLG